MSPVALTSGVEYYACRLTVQYAKTVGSGACAACDHGLCMQLTEVRAVSNSGATQDFWYGEYYPAYQQYPIQPRSPGIVSWQCAAGRWTYSEAPYAPAFFCDPIANCSVPVQNRTWGSIKALYR